MLPENGLANKLLFVNTMEVELLEFCCTLKNGNSKSDMRRLITGGGVYINNQKITDAKQLIKLEAGIKIKMGRLTFIELTD